MADSLALDIQERTIAFLAGENSLADFQDWLVGATWNVEGLGDPEALEMTYEIKLALAEHGRGDIDALTFRQRLSEVVRTTTRVAHLGGGADVVLTFDTTSKPITAALESQTVHTQYARGSW